MVMRDFDTLWDRKTYISIKENFKELFNYYIKSGLDAAEAREKAIQAVADAEIAKETAETTREEMLAIIREQTQNGDLAPEIAQSRQGHATLGENLNSIKSDLAQRPTKSYVDNNLNSIKSDLAQIDEQKTNSLNTVLSFTIGDDGDFSTINEALETVTNLYPSYSFNSENVKIELILKSGFIMREQVFVRGINLSHIILISEDETVEIDRQHLTQISGVNVDRYAAFYFVEGAVSFVIDVLFNMNNTGEATQRNGFFASLGSTILFKPGAGCKNAGSRGLHLSADSNGVANNCVFTGAGEAGIRLGNNSTLVAEGVDVSDSLRGLLLSTSKIDARGAIIKNCDIGIRASNSYANTQYAVYDGCKQPFSLFEMAEVYSSDISAVGFTSASTIFNNSKLNVDGSSTHGTGDRLFTVTDSELSAKKCNLDGSRITGQFTNSVVNLEESAIKEILVQRGSNVNAFRATSLLNTEERNIFLSLGANVVNAHQSTLAFSNTPNNMSSNGIIFKDV